MNAPEEPTRFACNHCGACCETHRVPVTHADLERLEASGVVLADVLDALPPEAVDMEGEPESFVTLREGRRLLVLAHRSTERGTACVFWRDGRCLAYTARPASCRTYPFELDEPTPNVRTRLTLHPHVRCDRTTGLDPDAGSSAPETTTPPPVSRESMVESLRARDRELESYVELVARWNRQQRRRHLAGHRPLSREAFVGYLRRP